MKTFKPLTPVKVIHEKSKFFGKVGRVINANNKAVVVDFGDKVCTTLFRWQIEPTTKYTDKSIKSEALEKIGNGLKAEIEFAQSQIDNYGNFNTPFSFGYILAMRTIKERLESRLNGNTI
jgi:hypothetical protein